MTLSPLSITQASHENASDRTQRLLRVASTTRTKELMQLKIRFVVTTQGLTFDDSPYSIFLIQLFAALAELENNHASERIRAGLAVARANGKKLGRRIDEKKRAKLLRWQAAKLPVKKQAKRLGVTPAAVHAMRGRMLAEPTNPALHPKGL